MRVVLLELPVERPLRVPVAVPVERLLPERDEVVAASDARLLLPVRVAVPLSVLREVVAFSVLLEREPVVFSVLLERAPVAVPVLREPEVVDEVASLREPEVVDVVVPSLRGVAVPETLLRVGVVAPLRPEVRSLPVEAPVDPVWRPEVVDVRVPEVWLLPVCGAFVVTLTPPSLLLTVGRFTPGVQGAVGLGAGVCGGRL